MDIKPLPSTTSYLFSSGLIALAPLHRKLVATVVAASLLCVPSAFAADASHFFGSWQVDVSKLPIPDPPKSVTITWADAGTGKVRMSVDIVDRRDVKTHAEGVFTPDGTPSRAVGSLDVDIISMTMPNDRVFVMGAGMAGNPSNTRVFVISDDGKRMSETIVSHGEGNVPVTRVNNWVRK